MYRTLLTQIVSVLMGAVVIMHPLSAAAQQARAPSVRVTSLGAGITTQFEPYRDLDEDPSANIIPSLTYMHGRFSLLGKAAYYDVIQTDKFTLAPLLEVRFQGYQADDGPAFAGMEDRGNTLETGVSASYFAGPFQFTGVGRIDVLDQHGGYDFTSTVAYRWEPMRATSLRAYVGGQFRSAELNDYYYGVLPEEAAVIEDYDGTGIVFDRPAYELGETWHPIAGMSLRQFVHPKWMVLMFAQHQFLDEAATDSPLLDRQGDTSFGVAVARFFR